MIETILVTMPMKKGDPTEYTYQWASKAVQMGKDLGYNVVTVEKDDTTYDNVTKMIQKYRPRLFLHLGHGCTNSLQGQKECIVTRRYDLDQLICMAESPDPVERQKLIKLVNPIGQFSCPGICRLDIDPCSPLCIFPTNINALKGSIVYAVACHSAAGLGRCAINYGVQSYVGFQDLLMFPVDSLGSQNIFGEVNLSFVKELLLGRPIIEAESVMSELEDSYIRRFKKIKYISLPLLWNKLNRKIIGDKNALLYQ